MSDRKASRRERLVLGTLILGLTLFGLWAVSAYPLSLNGRPVPPDPLLAIAAAVLGVAVVAGAVVMSTRFFGTSMGLKFVGRELWTGLLAGGAVGGFIGFFLRASLPWPAIWLVLVIVYVAAAAGVYGFATKGPAGDSREGSPWNT